MADTKISALTEKTLPVGADIIHLLDSAAANADKRTTLAYLRTLTSAPGEHLPSGLTISMTAGAALARGNVCYIGADGKLELCDANAAATMPAFCMVVDATIAENAVGNVLVYGVYQDASWSWATVGALLYPGETAGAIVDAAPSGTVGNQVQPCGWVLAATKVFFCFYPLLVEVGLESIDVSTAQTMTNKRITKRVKVLPYNDATQTVGETADYNTDLADIFYCGTPTSSHGIAGGMNFGPPGGTPTAGQQIEFLLYFASAQTITWDAVFVARGVALPGAASGGTAKYVRVLFQWNDLAGGKWDCIAAVTEA